MVKGSKPKKSSKAREASPAGETNTARAGDDDEPSTSQDRQDQLTLGGGDEEMSYQKLAKPFTDAQDREITVFFGQHPCFYDKTHQDYKNKKRREALIKEFAQTMFASEHDAWADKIWKRYVNLRTDYQKLEHQRDPSQPLTARQKWKLTDLSYLKSFYKQRAKSSRCESRRSSRNSTERDSDDEPDDRGHESSASSRRETPTKNHPELPEPVLAHPMPSRRPRRITDDSTGSGSQSSKLSQIVKVMKDSASHLVSRSQSSSLDQQEQERLSFYQWMFKSTRKIPRGKWRELQTQAFQLAMSYSTDSPQGNTSRARASQGSSTSSSLADQPQYPVNPPARPPLPASGGFVEMLHPQPTEMVQHRGTQPTGWEPAAWSGASPGGSSLSGLQLGSPSLSFNLSDYVVETGSQNTSVHRSTPSAAAGSAHQLPDAGQKNMDNDSAQDDETEHELSQLE